MLVNRGLASYVEQNGSFVLPAPVPPMRTAPSCLADPPHPPLHLNSRLPFPAVWATFIRKH